LSSNHPASSNPQGAVEESAECGRERTLRITFVAPFGIRRKGTTQARVIPLAAALAQRGHSVRVLIPDWDCPADAGRRYHVDGAEVRHLAVRPGGDGPFSPRLLAATYREALAGDPQVVHCFKPIGYAGAVALLVVACSTPHLARLATASRPSRSRRRSRHAPLLAIDCDDLEGRAGWATRDKRPSWQIALIEAQERLGMHYAPLVTVASAALFRLAHQRRGRGEGVTYLPNAAPMHLSSAPAANSVRRLDATRLASLTTAHPRAPSEPSGDFRLVLYTRFNEFAPARGVAAVAAVLQRLPTAELVVIGEGDTAARKEFEAGLQGAGVAGRCHWMGYLVEPERHRVLSSAHGAIWLFDDTPINRARSPAKLLELLAMGLPVIAEDVGETRALIGRAGVLVPPCSREALIAAVARLADSRDTRLELANAARRRIAAAATWLDRAATLERTYLLYT
jgi:glycosyltransferase involved in cell wall biosynthesis